jgi:cathepsin L
MKLLCLFTLLGVPASVHGAGLRPALRATKLSAETDVGSYSFEQFVRDFDRHYSTAEYGQRLALFQESSKRILVTKEKIAREGRSWTAGVHQFMDWTPEERTSLQGYKPSRALRNSGAFVAELQLGNRGMSHARLNSSSARAVDSYLGDGAPIRDQGRCGSCWAISAVEAIEAQLQKSGHDVRVSAQALIDCVPNPKHCGGNGGCHGATGELAYAFMQQHGIPLESDLPYKGETGTCQMGPSDSFYPTKKRATVGGFTNLPSNQGQPLKEAIVSQGSVVVAVAAGDWFEYQGGIFDGCDKDAVLGHAVLAKGFGSDSGKDYWTIQNSWGQSWGENGNIRLLRHDSDDAYCGTDNEPSKGLGCDGGPASIRVCGMCGVLYDPLYPENVRIEDDADVGSRARVAEGDYTPWTPGAPKEEPKADDSEAAMKKMLDMSF